LTAAGDRQLRDALHRWRGMRLSQRGGEADTAPGCVYGLMTRDAIEDVAAELEDVKAELRWVRVTILAAIITAAVGTLVRLAGW
jgi:hypothetical protein